MTALRWLACLLVVVHAHAARASSDDDPGASGFTVRYRATHGAAHARLRATLERQRVLELVATQLDRMVVVPASVRIETVECQVENAFYDARTRRVTICYELIDHFLDAFGAVARDRAQLERAVIGATLFTFLHEASHGLIDVLDLPAVGREEDAADQLATLTLLAMGREGVALALAGARWFRLQAREQRGRTPVWDEHGLDAQRYYNVLCMIYGSDPDHHEALVGPDTLPRDRASRCRDEYVKIDRAWRQLLRPYRRAPRVR